MSWRPGRVPFEPGEGVKCLVCGDEMRTLARHLQTHGLNAKTYRERFPGAAVTGPVLRAIRRDLYDDRIDAGVWEKGQKSKTCAKGHRLSGKNLLSYASGRTRACRTCRNEQKREYNREYYKRNRESRLVYATEYREKNRETINANRRKAAL